MRNRAPHLALASLLCAACGGDPAPDDGAGGSGAGSTNTNTTTNTTTTTSTATNTGDAEPPEMNGMTAAHNAARASVSPPATPAIPPLAWDGTIGAYAQAYADNCVWQHSGGPYGENIYATSGSVAPGDVVASWMSEEPDYDYAANSCSAICGHYTQVVWRDTARLGCGVTNCASGAPWNGGPFQFWVCDYDPPGNFNGQRPY